MQRLARLMKNGWLAVLLVAIVFAPLLLQPRDLASRAGAERTLVIITPHNEAIRYEFGRGFAEWHHARTGERVRVDWRSPGGTSEIARYLAGEYFASFQNHWTRKLNRPWSGEVERAYTNHKIVPGPPGEETIEQQARRAFLESDCSSKIDLFFGGGTFDYQLQADAGRLVDSGVVQANPDLFGPNGIPPSLGGEAFWDPEGRWIGTCLGAFGICSNADSLKRLGIPKPPARWIDLADQRYFREVALANPTQSSSVNKAFEMLIQQHMLATMKRAGAVPGSPGEREALAQGWSEAMKLIRKIGANARYFTDSSTKIALDVGAGEAAAGMTIDFYGRFQSEALRSAGGVSRLYYADAIGGTSAGADPIGLLRGAPNRDIAVRFIEYSMSREGQKLWNWKVGAPGGPHRYALRRLPIHPALYTADLKQHRSDADVNPYELAQTFTYHGAWTGPLFRQIAFVVRVMCIDPHQELASAWQALARAGFPPEATRTFENTDLVAYARVTTRFKEALGSKITEVQLAKELADAFRSQYLEARKLAESGR
jgi:iron(III) transport system substrate-binding protein